MYTHIDLSEWNKSRPIRIYQYLSNNPHVANYIRTLHITIVHHRIDSSQWYNQVSSILQMLPSSLESITLLGVICIDATGSTTRRVLVMWSDFPATFRKAFLDCLWSPNIIEATLRCIGGVPLSIFNSCTRLKRLSLVECITSTSDAQFPPQIDSLVLSRSEDLSTIVSWANTSHDLRSLNFGLDHRADQRVGYGQLTWLLDSYSDSLIKLELDFRPLCRFTFLCKKFMTKHTHK